MKGESPFDVWTLVHAAAGYVLGKFFSPGKVLAILVSYELLEAALRGSDKNPNATGLFEYESVKNILADVAIGFAASMLARR
jgi:hypothetical protein